MNIIEKSIDDSKRLLNVPIYKHIEDLYFVIDKKTEKRVFDNTGKPLIITKNEIKKLKNDYTTMSMVDVMKTDYEKKLENQRKRMEYDSMSDDEKKNLLRKQLDEGR